jgi:hypothetical protein
MKSKDLFEFKKNKLICHVYYSIKKVYRLIIDFLKDSLKITFKKKKISRLSIKSDIESDGYPKPNKTQIQNLFIYILVKKSTNFKIFQYFETQKIFVFKKFKKN